MRKRNLGFWWSIVAAKMRRLYSEYLASICLISVSMGVGDTTSVAGSLIA